MRDKNDIYGDVSGYDVDAEDKMMKETMDACYDEMARLSQEIDDYNANFVRGLGLSFAEQQCFFSEDLAGGVGLHVTSNIEKCDSPKDRKPDKRYSDGINVFEPIYVSQSCGYCGDDWSGTIWFHYKNQCYKFNFEC